MPVRVYTPPNPARGKKKCKGSALEGELGTVWTAGRTVDGDALQEEEEGQQGVETEYTETE